MTEAKAPYTVLREAAASVRLDGQTQYSALDVLIAGCDDEELRERAEAEKDRLEARLAAANELIAWLQTAIHSAAGNMTAADAKIRQWKEKDGQ